MRFAKILDQINIEKEFGGPENTQVKVDKFYSLLEATTALVFRRKKIFDEEPENKVNRNKIPMKIRQLMKKKSKLSKKLLISESWEKNYKRIEELKEIEEELKNSYDEIRKKKEKKAIKTLLKTHNYFTVIKNISARHPAVNLKS